MKTNEDTRFKTGQSGNPRGRPKGTSKKTDSLKKEIYQGYLFCLCDELLNIIDRVDYNKPDSVAIGSENSFNKIEEIRKIVNKIKGTDLS